MMRKLQLLAAAVLAEGDAIVCKITWERQHAWPLTVLIWFFAITSIVACWKLINLLEKK